MRLIMNYCLTRGLCLCYKLKANVENNNTKHGFGNFTIMVKWTEFFNKYNEKIILFLCFKFIFTATLIYY